MAAPRQSSLPGDILTAHGAHRYFSDAITETCRMVSRLAADPAPVVAIEAVFEGAFASRWHSHARGQISYIAAGSMSLQGDGYLMLVPAGHAVWIPAGHSHQATGGDGTSVLSIYTDASAMPPLPDRCAVLQVSDLFAPLFRRMIARQVIGRHDAVDDAMLLLLHEEVRVARLPDVTAPMPSDPRLARVCAAVLRDPALAAGKEDLARIGNMSARTMTRLFRSEMGMTFTDWLQQARGVFAVARLTTGQPVAQVASDLGYASASAFAAMFRRQFGHSPSDVAAGRRPQA